MTENIEEKWIKGEEAKKLGISEGKYRIRKSRSGSIIHENITPLPPEIVRRRLEESISRLDMAIENMKPNSKFLHAKRALERLELRKEALIKKLEEVK